MLPYVYLKRNDGGIVRVGNLMFIFQGSDF